jgi:carboxylate-amine ligase
VGARQIGVEEELFLVDPGTRRLVPVSDRAIGTTPEAEEGLEQELFLQQVETTSEPQADLGDLRRDIGAQRRLALESADDIGAALMAAGTPVLAGDEPTTTPKDRYRTMIARFGEIGRQGLVCATHVHVDVTEDEVVGVIDDLRPWLPLLLAVSANSPYADGIDTGYASWRAQLWDGWPSAGPVEPFGDLDGYRAAVRDLIASGAALDEGMIYFDARVARSFPTVEIRVADVCTEIDDTVLVAELARALVETAARARAAGRAAEPWRVELLRAARWRARHDGLAGSLVDPTTRSLAPAEQVLTTLVDHLRPALEEHGSTAMVEQRLHHLLVEGTGAERQRSVAGDSEDLMAVVDDLVRRTRSSIG